MSLCPYANVLIPFLRIYCLSSKHDEDLISFIGATTMIFRPYSSHCVSKNLFLK